MVATKVSTNDYLSTLQSSMRVNWRVEDIIGGDKHLDFTKPFLPESLASVNSIVCLNHLEKLTLNQIRGNSYLYLFGLVEEFILPAVIDHVRQTGYEDIYATQAFLHFAEEESKHIRLFRRFSEEFAMGFGSQCHCIGPAQEIANTVMAHSSLGVALIILHIEWLTQRHYLESVRDNQALDPQFCSLLRHHWLEEAQHTRLDTLMIQNIALNLDDAEIQTGIQDYFEIVKFLNSGLQMQVQLDLESLSQATGRSFSDEDKQEIQTIQEKSYQWTFLGSGITHQNFRKTFGQLRPAELPKLDDLAKRFV